MSYEMLSVSPEMVALGKKQFRFAEGFVTMEKLGTLKSWLLVGNGDGLAVVFTPRQGGKVQKIIYPLSQQDQSTLTTLVARYNAA